MYVFALISVADVISLGTGCADHMIGQGSAFLFNCNTLPMCRGTASFFQEKGNQRRWRSYESKN